jgi:hypothetical protein
MLITGFSRYPYLFSLQYPIIQNIPTISIAHYKEVPCESFPEGTFPQRRGTRLLVHTATHILKWKLQTTSKTSRVGFGQQHVQLAVSLFSSTTTLLPTKHHHHARLPSADVLAVGNGLTHSPPASTSSFPLIEDSCWKFAPTVVISYSRLAGDLKPAPKEESSSELINPPPPLLKSSLELKS